MTLSVAIKDLMRSLLNIHRQGAKRNIALFATPRGGSTWVMELLAAQPYMKFYDEPLNVRRQNVKRTGLFGGWDELMPESAEKKKVLDYLIALSRGRYGNMNPPPFRKNHRLYTNRIVYKIHAAKHLINDVRNFCNCDVVYLLRHPISNTLSRKVFPRLEYFLNSEYYMEGLLSREQAAEVRRIVATDDHMKKGIVSWCFENIDAHRSQDKDRWTVLTYEELIQRPIEVCHVLGGALELPSIERTIAGIEKASTNIELSDAKTRDIVAKESGEERVRYLVSRWRDVVSEATEAEYFSIVDVFGIDFYEIGRDCAVDKYLLCLPKS